MEWKSFEEFKSILVTLSKKKNILLILAVILLIEYFKCNWDWLRHVIYDYILD